MASEARSRFGPHPRFGGASSCGGIELSRGRDLGGAPGALTSVVGIECSESLPHLDEYTHVIGVDTHARTHTYVILDTRTGGIVDTATFPTSPPGLARALAWLDRRASAGRLAAVEGISSYGACLTEALHQAEIPVVEAWPPRRAGRGARGKSDPIDAEAAARAVLRTDIAMLSWPRSGRIRSALRVLLAARRSMDSQRTASRNAVTALLRTINLSASTFGTR